MKYRLTLSHEQMGVVRDSMDLFLAIAGGDIAQIDKAMVPWGRPAPSSLPLSYAALRSHYFPHLEDGARADLPDDAPFSDIVELKGREASVKGDSVVLTISMSEAFSLVKALDYYSRVGMGQIHTMTDILNLLERFRDRPEDLFAAIKWSYFPELAKNAYHGIHSQKLPHPYKIAWDIQQVLRHRASWDRHPQGGYTVNFDPPLSASLLPLPTIEKLEMAGGQ